MGAGWYPRLEQFWQKDDLKYYFPREVQAIRCTECTVVDRCLSAARCFEEAGKIRRLAVMKAAGVSRCQETPWSVEPNGKELHGAAGSEYDQEPRESAVPCTWSTRSQHNPFKRLQKNVVLDTGFEEGGVLLDPLNCCTAVHYLTVFSLANCVFVHIRKKVASLYSRIASLYLASVRSGRVIHENSLSQVIRSGRLNWEGIIA